MSHADTSRIFQIKSITNKLEKIHKDRFQKANLLFDEAIKDKCPDDLEIMNSSNWYGIIRSSNDYMVLDSDFNKYNQWHCEVFLRKDWHDVVLHRKAMILEFEPNGSKLISARITFCHVRMTFSHVRMTFSHVRMTFSHVRMTFSHVRMTFSHVRMTFSHVRMIAPSHENYSG